MTVTSGERSLLRVAFERLTGARAARAGGELSEAAAAAQPRNFFLQIAALILTKSGDRLASPKLVLAWVLTHAGAPGYMLGLLVPLRESLALLPQLAVARLVRLAPVRKWFWVGGSIVQGLAVLLMAPAALRLEGAAAGIAILALLTVFSLARGVCSVAVKDVLGKTVAKRRRGALSGYAASVAGGATVAFGLYAALAPPAAQSRAFFAAALAIAALLWLAAAFLYSAVAEQPGDVDRAERPAREIVGQLALIREDPQLRQFLVTRTLLLSTALVAPFYVSLAGRGSGAAVAGLGWLLAAAGAASLVSAGLWGRLSDRSSRRVMIAAALLAAAAGIATFAGSTLSSGGLPQAFFAITYFVLCVAHAGVRVGRSTHLVDMAEDDNRASYVAVSNTVIGVMLLAGSGFGAVAEWFGAQWAVFGLACVSALAALAASRLEEVQDRSQSMPARRGSSAKTAGSSDSRASTQRQ